MTTTFIPSQITIKENLIFKVNLNWLQLEIGLILLLLQIG